MGKKKSKPIHKPFESATTRGLFAKITFDMMKSPAWQALSLRQQGLYLTLKAKYWPYPSSSAKVTSNENDISLPTSEAKTLYPDLRGFRKDIDQLIECGFIGMEQHGWSTREVNIFGFRDRWKKYGQPDYSVPIKERRQPLKWQSKDN